jgi:hypothetical protein
MDNYDKELLDKIKEASKPVNFFTVKVEYNGNVVLAKKDFPADQYTHETIQKTHLQFLTVDFCKKLQEELKKQGTELQEEKKRIEMEEMWKKNDGNSSSQK